MKCIECKWFVGQTNDQYGVCKRYPTTQNKSQHDWCGEYSSKVEREIGITEYDKPIKINFVEPTEYEAPKRGRKPKA
jgi:hypothetical protein